MTIPVGKALVPVESEERKDCEQCFLATNEYRTCNGEIRCDGKFRKDGKNVIFKLVEYPAKEKK